jgi:hypothetical protein
VADGTILNVGTGGDTIQTEQPGGTGVKYPVTKIYTGALDVNGGPVTAANPFDVRVGSTTDVAASGTISATDAVVAAPGGAGVLLTGTSTANSYIAVACPGGDSAWNLQLTGTFGGGTIYFEESLDSTTGADGNWIAVNGRQTGVITTVLSNGTAVAGIFRGNTSGAKYYRARIVGATTPSVAVAIRMSSGTGAVFLNASIPTAETLGATNALGALNAAATINAAGRSSVGFFLAAGTLIGTITPECSYDGGTTWVQATFDNPVNSLKTTTIVFGSANTATSLSIIGSAGASQYRVRVSAFTSGTANGTLRANDVRDPSALFTAPPAQAVPGVIAAMGASDGSLLQAVRLAAKGTQAAFGLGTQDLKDSGRVNIAWSVDDQALTAATETLITVTESRDGASTTTFTSKFITSGKRLRITSITVYAEMGGSTPVLARMKVRLRVNTAGATTNASPIQANLKLPHIPATAKNSVQLVFQFPDGFEILGDGTKTLGFSVICPEWVTTTVLPTISMTAFGFEY